MSFEHETGDAATLATATAEGNRPSTILLCGRCDAFACGQLVALAEHRALVKARLWDIDLPLAPFSALHGSALRVRQTEVVKERLYGLYRKLELGQNVDDEDDEEEDEEDEVGGGRMASSTGVPGNAAGAAGPKLNLATSTILGHYANRMRNQNLHTGKRL